jgi:hypothetical protein
MAVAKVVLVLMFFMYLRFGNRLFGLPFALGVVLAVPLILTIGLATPPSTTANPNAVALTQNQVDVTLRSYKIDLSTQHIPSGDLSHHEPGNRHDAQIYRYQDGSRPRTICPPMNWVALTRTASISLIHAKISFSEQP